MKKYPKFKLVKAFLGCFFVILMLVFPIFNPSIASAEDPDTSPEASAEETSDESASDGSTSDESTTSDDACYEQLGAIGWIVCPTTGTMAKVTDEIYEKIEQVLIINPLSTEDGSPVYEVWKVCRDLANIVFIIFLLIIVISQVTGLGINNYGIKKALPKLIVAAIFMNLSFLICSLGIEVSNILGKSIRGIFTTIEEAAATNATLVGNEALSSSGGTLKFAIYGSLTTIIATIALQPGIFWIIIPVVLGAVFSVFIGLLTVVLRQAVVVLLVMVAPLAIVANLLPNVDQYYSKWKKLLHKMAVFYPFFAVLFGASHLAGFVIIASANKDGFWTMVGIAVQIFPLFYAVRLMQMSDTFLGGISNFLHRFANTPLTMNRTWADSHRELTRQRHLDYGRTPSAHLNRYLENRRISRSLDTKEIEASNVKRGTAYNALSHYSRKGTISNDGERTHERQARNARYTQIIEADKNNYNRGLAGFSKDYQKIWATTKQDFSGMRNAFSTKIEGKKGEGYLEARLGKLDERTVNAFDSLKYEAARGARIEYENAKHFQKRSGLAIDANIDKLNINNAKYQRHEMSTAERAAAELRYKNMVGIMEGDELGAHFAAADAAYMYSSQAQFVQGKFKKYFELTAPTQDVIHRLRDFTTAKDSNEKIDPIIAGLSVLNQRGDTDLVRAGLRETLIDADTGERKVHLGTYASQSIANFCMFDVKDNDPALRRFGKYINLETARMFNEKEPSKRRVNPEITIDEYINGEYDEYDLDENYQPIKLSEENGKPKYKTHKAHPKRDASILLEGTSFKGIERTAISNMTEMIREASYDVDENGSRVFNYTKCKNNFNRIWPAIMPNFISDQFSFLSGSEPIKAFAKGVTGMNDDHVVDWEGIFGKEEAAKLTPEQKKDFFENVLLPRTGSFLKGHVPNQIARTKSDMLGALLDLYRTKAAIDNGVDMLSKTKFANDDEYEVFKNQYTKEADSLFTESFDETNLKGFVKMAHKGYQGDAKANLNQHLHTDELYEKYFGAEDRKNAKRNRRERDIDDDEDEGAAQSSNTRAYASYGDSSDAMILSGELSSIDVTLSLDDYYDKAMEFFSKHPSIINQAIKQSFTSHYQGLRANGNSSAIDLYSWLADNGFII